VNTKKKPSFLINEELRLLALQQMRQRQTGGTSRKSASESKIPRSTLHKGATISDKAAKLIALAIHDMLRS
jgi:hypothetical protein